MFLVFYNKFYYCAQENYSMFGSVCVTGFLSGVSAFSVHTVPSFSHWYYGSTQNKSPGIISRAFIGSIYRDIH